MTSCGHARAVEVSYTLRGQVSLFEGLEVQSQQRAEGLFVEGVGLLQTALDGVSERAEVWVMLGVQALFLDELPQALNEVGFGE